MSQQEVRTSLITRLIEDLVGPREIDEILKERPTEKYVGGILYPRESQIGPEEDEDGGGEANAEEDAALAAADPGVALYATRKPSSAGLSFAAQVVPPDRQASLDVRIRCATYERFAVDDKGQEKEGEPKDRSLERWRRRPNAIEISLPLKKGERRLDLKSQGTQGLELYQLVTSYGDFLTCTIALSNRNTPGEARTEYEQNAFFQVELIVSTKEGAELVPRPSRRAALDEDGRIARLIYLDSAEYAVGHTCSATADLTKDGRVTSVRTTWMPTSLLLPTSDRGAEVFQRLRNNARLRPLSADWLAEAPSEILGAGLTELRQAYASWIDSQEARIPALPQDLQEQAKIHMQHCREAEERIAEGIEFLAKRQDVRTAFQLSNRAMQMQFQWSRGEPDLEWRPFQVAFQLLCLSTLAERDHPARDIMDLLWFPTGGGKTEAYLALTAFVILLRRLRASETNDGAGVAVLMRYTLRVLTIQQFQRAAAMICACELLRRKGPSPDGNVPDLGQVPISIGLWVGAGATPLTLKEARAKSHGDPSTPEQLMSCPCCQEPLFWKLTNDSCDARCTSPACALGVGGLPLPLYTIDELIYRERPSLIIGTVDKFAQIVRKVDTAVFFGEGERRSPPDLIIQDELHLISGPLGTIAGLYEVAIDELCRRGTIRPKVIGSTATIRRATEQIKALFDRRAYQFPPPGLDASDSGFAIADVTKPGRLYLGITTAGRSAKYVLQAVAASLLQSAGQPDILHEERDPYWTLVAYFNSLRELGSAVSLMQDDVSVSIRQYSARREEECRELAPPAELTSRVGSSSIRDMLAELEVGAGEAGAIDILLASNMISVGMDIPRLGLMVVNSQPKSLAEYIQATSRVGRGNVPGLVVTIYNNARARDRSHYETFETWHSTLYREVEATSVTPFASRAQDKALHAVLVALVRHLFRPMRHDPILNEVRRPEVEKLAALIEARAARVDQAELPLVSKRLKVLLDEWSERDDLTVYWDDYGKKPSLLVSAEQYAASQGEDSGAARRALWPTPNSMRDVEAGVPFILKYASQSGGR